MLLFQCRLHSTRLSAGDAGFVELVVALDDTKEQYGDALDKRIKGFGRLLLNVVRGVGLECTVVNL